MDGRQLASQIVRAQPTVRVLFVSGHADWPDASNHFVDDAQSCSPSHSRLENS